MMKCNALTICVLMTVVDSVFLFKEVNAAIIVGIPYRALPTQNSGQRSALLCFLPDLCGIKNRVSPTI